MTVPSTGVDPNIDYSSKYLTFEALEDGTFQFTDTNNIIQYSIDNGNTWVNLAPNTNTPTINSGNKIMWKMDNPIISQSNPFGIGTFTSLGRFNAEGNIMSLLYGNDFIGKNYFPNQNYVFCGLFSNCDKLINCNNLILPVITLNAYCYSSMFWNCTSLISAPELPATTLANSCYGTMFRKCISLISAPELPATTLAISCYAGMFEESGLITAPELPATTLAQSCYEAMFYMCYSLTTPPSILPAMTLASSCYNMMFETCTELTSAPILPALNLVSRCYEQMFYCCSKLKYIKALFLTNPSEGFTGFAQYTNGWVWSVSSTGIFVKNSAATWTGTGNYLIPSGWTVTT